MEKFRLKADATFFAENLDDAFKKLSDHFAHMRIEDYMVVIFESGEISIEHAE